MSWATDDNRLCEEGNQTNCDEKNKDCKTQRILGERQDTRIAKETGKLQKFEQGLTGCRGKVTVDKNGRRKEVGIADDKISVVVTADNEKIARDMACKVEGDTEKQDDSKETYK